MARSENNAVGNQDHTDLNLTHYPRGIDSRQESDDYYNSNMAGYANREDYNMAEHVNAMADAIMALQRTIGAMPHVDTDGVDRSTVSTRIRTVEDRDWDDRYGGSGWDTSQNLVGHTHDGSAGGPSQIRLGRDVQGTLDKSFLNLDEEASGGLSGADLAMSPSNSTTINQSVEDRLSMSKGGRVHGDTRYLGKLESRLFREFDAETMFGTKQSGNSTMTGSYRRRSGTDGGSFVSHSMSSLQYGQYVIGVRARVSSRVDERVLRVKTYTIGDNHEEKLDTSVDGSEFRANGEWQMFYFTTDHETTAGGQQLFQLRLSKDGTSASVDVDIDHVFVMPTHTAVLDR